MKITTFGRVEHRALSEALNKAIKAVGDEFGVDLVAGGGQIGMSGGVVKVTVELRDTGAGKSGAKAEWDRYCGAVGMKPEHFGQTFAANNQMYRISGLNLSARSYPIQAERVFDNKTYKFSASTVCAKFPKKAAA
ncbi:hypothetical protein [Agrobacterium sp. CG674]